MPGIRKPLYVPKGPERCASELMRRADPFYATCDSAALLIATWRVNSSSYSIPS